MFDWSMLWMALKIRKERKTQLWAEGRYYFPTGIQIIPLAELRVVLKVHSISKYKQKRVHVISFYPYLKASWLLYFMDLKKILLSPILFSNVSFCSWLTISILTFFSLQSQRILVEWLLGTHRHLYCI